MTGGYNLYFHPKKEWNKYKYTKIVWDHNGVTIINKSKVVSTFNLTWNFLKYRLENQTFVFEASNRKDSL